MIRFDRFDRQRLGFLAGLFVSLLLSTGPIGDPDLPWHLSSGHHVLASRTVPREDFLSWTMAGRPWVDFEWGAQVIFYGLEKAGGATALWIFKCAAFFGLTLALVALLTLWKLPGSWIGLAGPPFALALFPMTQLRPEVFSLLFFSLEFYLLERRRLGLLRLGSGALLTVHAVLYIVWANLHAGFVTGLLLCCCYGVGELIATGRRKDQLPAFALAAAGLAGTFANPYGYRIHGVLFDHWRHLSSLRQLIVEWEPPSFLKYHLDGYWLIVAFSFTGLLLAVVRGVALPAEHVVAIFVFGLFTSRAVRTVPYAILLFYPLALAAWSNIPAPRWWRPARAPMIGLALALVGWRCLPIVRTLGILAAPPTTVQGPERACAFLRAEKSTLKELHLYNPYNWGGYLDYALFPDYKVFIDGRYIFADLLKQVEAVNDDPGRWRGLMTDNGIGLAILHNDGFMLRPRGGLGGRPFTAYAMPRVEWALVYWDAQAIVLVQRNKVPRDWLTRHEFRLIYPHDLRLAGLKVVAGIVSLKDVSAEIDRYAREIGDPREVLILRHWRAEFERGLTKPARRIAHRPPAMEVHVN